jgi:hypothetical protein
VVLVALEPEPSTPPVGNVAPFIDSLVASDATVAPGGTLAVRARARDANAGDVLGYSWRATGGTFEPLPGSTEGVADAVWTAPGAPGTETLTLVVSDAGGAFATLSVTVQVAAL